MSYGTIHNRDSFLNDIAKQLGRKRSKHIERPTWTHSPQQYVFQDASSDELADHLEEYCEQIHTECIRTLSISLQEVVEKVVETNGGGEVIVWDDPRFSQYGLSSLLDRQNVHVWDTDKREENIQKAAQANVGITFSDITLSESGTVVLFNGGGKGRSVSLLPTTYIAIIPKSTIVPRMTQAAQYIHQKVEGGEDISSCINFITGPSNSADIEMNLVVGVHGPVKATYIIVEDC
ncbi:lactate utilization protein C [Priestia endophytica]|jgi:L-lactate dehydrogenase complex protein LldG|uniref:LutC/YkgG family protein n=1 Tax=Priestia endophytica TaxID=135735 RepID=UPI000DCA711C|nr:lactate utilization protein C [Priestia endophytica]RAS73978.1 lactate utilization protein C [Priestia endophytica]RAS81585.1 lactate utilization protein C [Priestia endophytica]